MSGESFETWFHSALTKIDADVEEYGDYLLSVSKDKSVSIDDRIDMIQNILSGITDADLDEICSELRTKLDELDHAVEVKKEPVVVVEEPEKESHVVHSSIRQRILEERLKAEEDAKVKKHVYFPNETAQRNRNALEQKINDRIVHQYGFEEFAEEVNGEMVYHEQGDNSAELSSESGNDNLKRVIEAEKHKREEMKAQHEKEQAAIKRQKELEKEKKEKAKRRTQKRERQAVRM